ncbi:hypothetical protein PsYK624_115340 [Phanerochaete sordida]|uniref:F-box domain-containing protein n=1 Tax=Phanerochaete sordida TaxID=48140 RepID=A0A9P3LHI1_9APHY|nr:hypothetical protein PsYK624_115340 [Phanerochaete sordida]
MPVLPGEITDMIIDGLQDSPVSLKHCSLVCKSWFPRASLHLFRSFRVSIHIRHGAQVHRRSTLPTFCKLLASSVRVIANVRQLNLNLSDWAVEDVASIIPHLTRLRRLNVMDTDIGAPETTLPCTGRHLEHLQFDDTQLTLVSYFLGLFESVGTLELSNFTGGEGPLPSRAFHVEHLDISHLLAGTLSELTQLLEVLTLKSVKIGLESTGTPVLSEDVDKFVRAVGAHIIHLEIDMGYSIQSAVADLPAMQACKRLESFTIATPTAIRFKLAGWHGAVFFLRHLPPQTCAVRLITNFSFETEQAASDTFRALDWRAVGDTLAERCPDLESLQLPVIKDDFGPVTLRVDSEVQQAIRAELPVRLRNITVFE